MSRRIGGLLACAVTAMAVAGCGLGPGSDAGLARDVLATRRMPPGLLRSAGLPRTYPIPPFVCGTSAVEAEQELHRAAATMPEDVRQALLAELRKAAGNIPPAEPDYVVDLSRVESVQLIRLGSRELTILGHPFSCGPLSARLRFGFHPQPPRLAANGPMIWGLGPATIWHGRRLLFAHLNPETMWLLADFGARSGPYLLSLSDFADLGGPIEIHMAEPIPDGRFDGQSGYLGFCWLDSSVTGACLLMSPNISRANSHPDILVEQSVPGRYGRRWQRVGRLAFDAGTRWYSLTGETPTTRPEPGKD